ncbi:MAG: DUF4240 domain-containing protein [Bacteroidetes bacterium]|nr:DUF4240 domain-containing protein [Bacteroidota bacterium]
MKEEKLKKSGKTMSNQTSQESSVEFSEAENIDQKIMEETAMIKGIIEYVKKEKRLDFYSEYKRLGGQLPKPTFKKHLSKFFDLTFSLYNRNSSLNLDGTYKSERVDVYSLWKDYIEDDLSNPPLYEKIEMGVEEFWQIIDNVKDSENPKKDIEIYLDRLPIGKLMSYQEHFDIFHNKANRWDIWGATYITNGGYSDDGFIDFRYWLISRGKVVYESVLENPDNLIEIELKDALNHELFGYVARDIYREKMGNDLPYSDMVAVSTFGERWDFDNGNENKKRLPRLWEKYGKLNRISPYT